MGFRKEPQPWKEKRRERSKEDENAKYATQHCLSRPKATEGETSPLPPKKENHICIQEVTLNPFVSTNVRSDRIQYQSSCSCRIPKEENTPRPTPTASS